MARFLDALAEADRPLSRTQLQTAVGVNYDILRRYLEFLLRKGYVGADERGAWLAQEGRAVRGRLRALLGQFLE